MSSPKYDLASFEPRKFAAIDLEKVPLRALVPQERGSAEGKLDGLQLDPRAIAEIAYNAGPKWKDPHELCMAVMICLAESQGYTDAHCDNFKDNADGTKTLLSRDVSLWEINIPASQVGTKREEQLKDPSTNAKAAYALYDRRGWQPWVAYMTKVCYHDAYLQRAALGVMSFVASHRVEEAKKFNAYQETPIPIFTIKQLPYVRNSKKRRIADHYSQASVAARESSQTAKASGAPRLKAAARPEGEPTREHREALAEQRTLGPLTTTFTDVLMPPRHFDVQVDVRG